MLTYLSLFSGIGGFELGLQLSNLKAQCIGYSEIDPYAIDVYQRHFPTHRNIGDITDPDTRGLPGPDLVFAGFPCTDLAICNTENLGLNGSRSGLIMPALPIIKGAKYFVVENVASMKKDNRDKISKLLGVEPVLLDAADVSYQQRKRLFWANFPIRPLPKTNLPDFACLLLPKSQLDPSLSLSAKEVAYMSRKVKGGRDHWDFGHHHDTDEAKSHCVPANLHKGVPYNVLIDRRRPQSYMRYRKLHPIEAERLMGFPDNWTSRGSSGKSISHSRRYKALGNAVSIRVVQHVFDCLAEHQEKLAA